MEKRLLKRLEELKEKVVSRESVVVHRISDNEAEQRAYYRLLQNERMSVEELSDHIIADCQRQVKAGATYLIFQDTTQPSLERNQKNIKAGSGLGVISDNKTLGFFLHPGLVLEADTYRSIGYSYIRTWSRNGEKAKCSERDYKSEPIEEKESYRWLECVKRSRQVLGQAGQVIVVSDREGDIFEVLDRLPDEKTHVLVRSKASRMILNEQGQRQQLRSFIEGQPLAGSYQLRVQGDKRSKRKGREASMEVRFAQATLLPPKRLGGGTQGSTALYIVEAKEKPQSCPPGEKPIHWILVTTYEVESLADAFQIIKWYKGRWNAEQIFRLSKRQGLNIEQSDLETGYAIIKMALLAILAASKIILLHQASKQEQAVPMEKTFNQEQRKCLATLVKTLEGKTPKQQNPYVQDSLQWAYWVLARLGGWKPHEKQAGVITLFRGWQRFNQIFEGWILAQLMS